jgi:hypothetical protein
MIATGAAGLVRRWVRVYTGGLPPELRDRRRDEIDADLWSQLEEAAVIGRPARSINAEILTRWLSGIPADLSWRLEHRGGAPVTTQTATASHPISPGFGVLAILGGFGLYSLMYRYSEATADDAFYWLGVLGELAIAAVLAALVLASQDRLTRTAVVLGSIGAAGMALAAIGAWWLMLVAPVCGAVLVWNLATLHIVGRWVAVVHAAGAVGLLGIGAAAAGGTTVNALFIALAVYPATWILIGLSLLRPTAVPKPAPAA